MVSEVAHLNGVLVAVAAGVGALVGVVGIVDGHVMAGLVVASDAVAIVAGEAGAAGEAGVGNVGPYLLALHLAFHMSATLVLELP